MPKTEDCEELLLKSLILAETTEIFTIGTFHKMDDWEKLLLNSLILAETTVIFVTGTFHKMDDWEELLLKSLIRAKTTVILLIGVFFIVEWLKKIAVEIAIIGDFHSNSVYRVTREHLYGLAIPTGDFPAPLITH